MNVVSSAPGNAGAKVEDDDITLILQMADRKSNPSDAEAALEVFFKRHHRLFKGFAEKRNFRSLGLDPEDFVLRTFHRAYDKAGTFNAPAGLTSEEALKKVQAWLFEIAKNEFLMELRKGLNKCEETWDPALLAPPDDERLEEDRQLIGKAAGVRTFLDSLPEADRQLLETSMIFFDYRAKKALIPEDILQGLADTLATTPEGIKQKRKRLLQKLKEYLETMQKL
jgi:RNA polymerase sigma factor (sigma-70 family)